MKINNNIKTNKYAIITGIILVVVAGYLTSAYFAKWPPFQAAASEQKDRPRNVNEVNYDKPTKEQQDAPTEMTESGSVNLPKEKTDSVTVVISSSQVDRFGALRIGTILQTLTSDGECTLLLTRNGQTVVEQKAGIQVLSNTSTCKGFTIGAEKLSSGTYTIELTYVHENIKGHDTHEVIVPQ